MGQHACYTGGSKAKGVPDMRYEMRYVRGHVEVYDKDGRFVFSADNEREAEEEPGDADCLSRSRGQRFGGGSPGGGAAVRPPQGAVAGPEGRLGCRPMPGPGKNSEIIR